MTAFQYRAARADGRVLAGTLDAASPVAALEALTARGLFPVRVQPAAARGATPVSLELASALSGLGALLDVGLPADRALAAVCETAPPAIAAAFDAAKDRVTQGAALSAALAESSAVPAAVVAYLRAGERSGRLAAAVQRAASEMEQAVDVRARVRGALTYPAFLALTGLISVTAIMGFVVPRFIELIDAGGRQLPASTRMLLALSGLTTRFGPLLLGLLVAAVIGLVHASRTERGRLQLHRVLLATPLLGALRLRLASARVAAALGSLLESGVPILPALAHAQDSAADAALEERLARAALEVERGERLADALERHTALSPLALRLARFGDRAGRLPAFLAHAARLETLQAQRTLQRAVTMIEPVLIVSFGLIVALVALAVFQAIYTVRPGVT